MIDLSALWHGLGPETKSAVIGAGATVVAAFAGFGGLISQIRSQGRLNRETIAETERRKIKAAMYEEAIAVCDKLSDTAIEFSNLVRLSAQSVEIAARAQAAGLNYAIPTARFPQVMQAQTEFQNAAVAFIFLVERRRIIDPRMIVFRTAVSAALHDLRENFSKEYLPVAMPSMPTELPDGQIYPYAPPIVDGAAKLTAVSELVVGPVSEVACYLEDFLVEMQNHLLGDLFGKQVPHREPIDPKSKVITLANFDELESYFSEETAWGQLCNKVNAETRMRFGVGAA
jgi:hypothetical protein